jgi:hypothetical protein
MKDKYLQGWITKADNDLKVAEQVKGFVLKKIE